MLCNANEGLQMKSKISHAKWMVNLRLHVHPVIANTEQMLYSRVPLYVTGFED